MKHTIIAKVDNVPGVVSRISGLFTRRGYNIESFVTSTTGDPAVYHLTFSLIAEQGEAELLLHQLGRIMEVIDVRRADSSDFIIREFMLVRVSAASHKRAEIMQLAELLKCKVVGMGVSSAVIEATGDSGKLDGVLLTLESYGIEEIVRSGSIGVALNTL